MLYLVLVGVAHALHYAQAVRQRDAQLARAQLQALTAQMRPHFLFNTLNTAASLMHDDVVAAERVLTQLGALLRRSLAAGDTPEVSLRSELDFLRLYVDIEQARFEDHLTVQWDLDHAALDVVVPHLILQPLVENALRHGIAPRATPGTVTIAARFESAELNYVRLHVGDRSYLIRDTLNRLEGTLDPSRFLRIHRSAIVQMDRVRALRSRFQGDFMLTLHSGARLKSGRSYRARIRTAFGC